MKKYLLKIMLSLLLAVSLIVPINADAVVAVKGATSITGGASGSLDSFDGATLNDGDICFVFYGTSFYFYKLDADSGLAESSPTIIAPDTSAGNKRWIIQNTAVAGYTADTFSETTVGAGVTIDGLKIKDSGFSLGSDADGDAYYRAAGVLARLALGAANQKMFVNAAGTAPEWALGIKTGTITRAMDAATGLVSYTGIGHKPSLLILMTASPLSTSWSIGFSLSTSTQFNMRGWGAILTPESGISLIVLLAEDAAQTKYQYAALTSFDTDGFTLNWIRTGVTAAGTATIGYIAFR